MTKINNTQRAAFTKMLKEAMETFQRTSDGTIYVNEYRNPEEYDGPEVAAAIKRHKVVALTAAVEAAQKALKTAYQQVRDDMEGHNAEKRTRREAELQAYTDAIREVWAAETVEEAKAVFARFPKA